VDRVDAPRTVPVRSLMGGIAFGVMMTAEFALGGLVFGRSVSEQLAGYASVPGVIGLVAQAVCAAFPVVQLWSR
jgi:hypothetical protein